MNTAFAILQGLSPNETKDNSEIQGSFSRSSFPQQNPQCIYRLKYLFRNCYYLNELIRPSGWKVNALTQVAINKKLYKNSKLKV